MTVSIVDTGTAAPAALATTFAASLVGATAPNLLLWIIGGDKNSGTITPPSDCPNLAIDLRTTNGDGHVTLALAYGTADGAETTLSGSVTTNTAGGQVWVAELADSVGTGAWGRRGTSTHLTDFSAVTGLALGPVSVTETGLAVAAVAADSVNTQGTVTWTSSSGHTFTARRATASGGGQAGLWIATAPVTKGDTVSVDFARAAGTADQHSGFLTVFAREVVNFAALAGSAPVPTGALAATETIPAVLAGSAPVPTGALAATETIPAVLAGSAPVPTGALYSVPPAFPDAAYNFDGSGTAVFDQTGNGHGFTLGGGVVRTTGRTGQGVANATGDGEPGAVIDTGTMAWAQTAARTVMLAMKDPQNTTEWALRWDVSSIGSGAWGFLINGSTVAAQARNAGGFVRATALRPTDGLWHHYAATYDGTNVRMYLDGVLTDTQTLAGPLRTDADSIRLLPIDSTATVVDDLRIYDEALSAEQIAAVVSVAVPDAPPIAAVLAGAAAVPIGALTATETIPAALAGTLPRPVGALDASPPPVEWTRPARAGTTATISTGPRAGSSSSMGTGPRTGDTAVIET